MQDITKFCADHLRAFTNNSHGIKLKASHAHELVAALFGYQCRAALLADTQHPVSNLREASIIVCRPTDSIDQRRKNLHDLPSDLPDTYTLTESVYSAMTSEKWLLRTPWPTFKILATFLADEYLRQQRMARVYRAPVWEGVTIYHEDRGVQLIVLRSYQLPMIGGGVQEIGIATDITLSRLAGHIGYAEPDISSKIEQLGRR